MVITFDALIAALYVITIDALIVALYVIAFERGDEIRPPGGRWPDPPSTLGDGEKLAWRIQTCERLRRNPRGASMPPCPWQGSP